LEGLPWTIVMRARSFCSSRSSSFASTRPQL